MSLWTCWSSWPLYFPILLVFTSFLSLLASKTSSITTKPRPSPSPVRGRHHPTPLSNHDTNANSTRLPLFMKKQLKRLRNYTAARLAATLVLSSLALTCVLRDKTAESVVKFISHTYLSLLAALSHHPPRSLSALRRRDVYALHLDILLVVAWVYALVKALNQRIDLETQVLYDTDLVLNTVIGILIPLIRPREYRGMFANPEINDDDITAEMVALKEALPKEQTASLLSLLTYSYLDTYIWSSRQATPEETHCRKVKSVALPELAYQDRAEVLAESSGHIVDTPLKEASRKSLLVQMLSLHAYDHMGMVVLLMLHVFANFGAPYGLRRVLSYLEHPSTAASPAPWLALLFAGPAAASVLLQLYSWLATRVALRVEGALMAALLHTGLKMRAGDRAGGAAPDAGSTQHYSPAPSIDSLLTTDVATIREARDWLLLLVCVPLNVALGIVFLYSVLGASALVGLATIGLLLPVPGWFVKRIRDVERERIRCTDRRVEEVGEAIGLLRMIKLFGWESYIKGRIDSQRESELFCIRKRRILEMAKGVANFLIPVATMLTTYATYVSLPENSAMYPLIPLPQTLFMNQQLTAAKVFSSMAVFDILRGQFHLVFHTLSQVAAGKVSLDRVEEYLWNTPFLDEYANLTLENRFSESDTDATDDAIGFRNVSFTWTAATPSLSLAAPIAATRPFTLRVEGEMIFPRGSFTLVVGPTGSGKTSLLLALLGEMHLVEDRNPHRKSWYNLPREGGVAYAAQETWVLNDTIRNNILFGSEYDAERYAAVLEQCALTRDLEMFAAGDATEVGEKGATLSGGQRARVTLARAVYSYAELLLLDDVFASLDVHTTQWIIEKCFAGDLFKGRTVILVTHNVSMAKKLATHVVRMGQDGRVANHGTINKMLFDALSKHAEIEDVTMDRANPSQETANTNSKVDDDPKDAAAERETGNSALISEEEGHEGRIDFDAVKLYMSALGGRHAFFFFATFVGGIVSSELLGTLQTWFLGYWAAQYDGPFEVRVGWYLSVYGIILACSMTVYTGAYITYIHGGLRASRTIHQKLVSSVIGTTFRWLDITPTSRIIARCTQDVGAVDGVATGMVQWLTELTVSMLVKLGAIVFITPMFLGPGLTVALFGGWLCQVYMESQLAVKREMSNSRAPILGHFGTTMTGLVSIRAFGAQDIFIREGMDRIDRYTRAARTFYNLTRWITIRLDFIGAFFTSSLAVYLVYFQSQTASNTGFSLNMSIAFSSMILYWVMFANELEVQGTSSERIQEYLRIDQESKSDASHAHPAYWPASGDLRVENLSARYSHHGTDILHDISFHVKAGEHVGIVGHTGSGKSSLTLALLRAVITSGHVYYDGIRTDQVNLEEFRSKVAIIPQVPEMLAGSLRQNLDPFDEFDDAHLNNALRSVGLFSLQENYQPGSGLTLDSHILAGGSNVSVGQRQIIALARAIIRNSKLLILDEAMSAIDHETDTLIQSTLRHQLGKDVTVLIVAHRLHTVMDTDKIMVLEDGRMVEFGHPQVLLQKPTGAFKALVKNSCNQ